MADLLQVEYAYTSDRERLDFSDVALPADLLSRLKEAAQFEELTYLEHHLHFVREQGKRADQLADQLLELSRAVEVAEILKILEQIKRANG